MVGKRHTSGGPSKKSPVIPEPALANRPKRNISPKCLDETTGLSWREERELKKALYASLQEAKKLSSPKSEPSSGSTTEGNVTPSTSKSDNSEPSTPLLRHSLPGPTPKLAASFLGNGRRSDPGIYRQERGQRASSLPNIPVTKIAKRRQLRASCRSSPRTQNLMLIDSQSQDTPPTSSINSRSNSLDESSQDSTSRSSFSTNTANTLKGALVTKTQYTNRAKVHAQRKFASLQNCGTAGYTYYPPSSQTTPTFKAASKTSPVPIFPKRAKTEDFLTFLCLRGTPALPPHLDFFNFTRYDGTNYQSPSKSGRESSPSSTSTSLSNFNLDEGGENSRTFSPVSKLTTPDKKAARACAGTPETARGLQGARPRLSKTSLKAQSPLAKSPGKVNRLKVTPQKVTRSSSIPRASEKMMIRRSSDAKSTPVKLSAVNKLTNKRRSMPTLTSKVRESKVRRTSLFDNPEPMERENSDNTLEAKNSLGDYERKVTSVGMELRVRVNLRRPKRKSPTDFIAMRLPKRQAKENALKFYMESDDLEDNESRSTSDEEITFPKKRKLDSGFDIDNCKIPFQRKKPDKKAIKRLSPKQKAPRCSKELEKLTGGNPEQLKGSIDDGSEGVSTRSATRKTEVNFPSRASATKVFADKRLQKIKEMKRRVMNRNLDNSTKRTDLKDKCASDQSTVSGNVVDMNKDGHAQGKKESPSVKKNKDKQIGPLTKPKEEKERRVPAVKQKSDPRPLHREVSTSMTEVPTFFPTEEEFQQPIKYIQSISAMAEPFGMCKIIPPSSWKMDGKISEDVRFTTQKQYIHKMYNRFGPVVEQLECIKRHLVTHNSQESIQVPTVGGVEIDLCKLSETIEKFGGMQNVIEKKKWMKVADAMNIPKLAQDRGTKLYDAYCKYLLSYNGLSEEERNKLAVQVKNERQKVKTEEQEEECVVKGKSMSLGAFNRVARNTATIWTKDEPMSTEQIERDFWNIVAHRSSYVVVHGGHVDTKTQNCSMFPSRKDNPYARHPWNLNNLPNHKSSLLQYLHHVSGVTVPTLHVGMLYTASCWSTDTHHLPYVQYLHSEADTVWYCIPSQEEGKFQAVMRELVPTLVSGQSRWLKEDTALVPPDVLLQRGVHVSRCVQQPHQFVVVFPKCYTANISCGYTLAESSHYATKDWILLGVNVAKILNTSREEELFSMEELLCNIAEDPHADGEILQAAVTELEKIVDREIKLRRTLSEIGLKACKRMAVATSTVKSPSASGRRNSTDLEESVTRCEISKKICHMSLLLNEAEDLALCLEQALLHLQKKKNIKSSKLLFRHTDDELKKILSTAHQRLKTMPSSSDDTSPSRKGKNTQHDADNQKPVDGGVKPRKKIIGQKNKIYIAETATNR